LTLAPDGRALLQGFRSNKTYRLEGQALLFSEDANHAVHVSGRFGSIMQTEDPNVPSFVVDTIDVVAPTCSANITAADFRRVAEKKFRDSQPARGAVGMSDMSFQPQTIEISAGQKVVWTNTSQVMHNVVADPAKAMVALNVKLPSGVKPFSSQMLQPGQSFSKTFDKPGVYKYVCTLHEGAGMKGVIIVKDSPVLQASK
jgi:plastocyanin